MFFTKIKSSDKQIRSCYDTVFFSLLFFPYIIPPKNNAILVENEELIFNFAYKNRRKNHNKSRPYIN